MVSAFRTFKLIMTTMLTIPAINITGPGADKLSSSVLNARAEVPVLTIIRRVNEILDPTLGNIAIKNYEF